MEEGRSSNSGGETEWDMRLPERLFATDRFPVQRLNIYSKVDLLSVIVASLKGTPEFELLRGSPLGKLFDLPVRRCPAALKLLHALICRQLVTKKRYEMWSVFGGQPIRFSLVEFASITGLNCNEFPKGYDEDTNTSPAREGGKFWNELFGKEENVTLLKLRDRLETDREMPGWKRLSIALILIVDGVLIAKHQVGRPTEKYVEMLSDVSSFLQFPWGRESFIQTIGGMLLVKKSTGGWKESLTTLRAALQQKTFRITGFPLVLQLWALSAIPLLLERVPDVKDKRTFMECEYKTRAKFTLLAMKDVWEVENDSNLQVQHMAVPDQVDSDEWTEWEDEVKDKKVNYMVGLIEGGKPFSKEMWPGGDASVRLYDHSIKTKKASRHRKGKSAVGVGEGGVKKGQKSSRRKQRRVDQYFRAGPSFADDQMAMIEGRMGKMEAQMDEIRRELKKCLSKVNKEGNSTRKRGYVGPGRLSARRKFRRRSKVEKGKSVADGDKERSHHLNNEEGMDVDDGSDDRMSVEDENIPRILDFDMGDVRYGGEGIGNIEEQQKETAKEEMFLPTKYNEVFFEGDPSDIVASVLEELDKGEEDTIVLPEELVSAQGIEATEKGSTEEKVQEEYKGGEGENSSKSVAEEELVTAQGVEATEKGSTEGKVQAVDTEGHRASVEVDGNGPIQMDCNQQKEDDTRGKEGEGNDLIRFKTF